MFQKQNIRVKFNIKIKTDQPRNKPKQTNMYFKSGTLKQIFVLNSINIKTQS